MGFQYGLVLSLAQAQGWLLSNEEVAELEHLTLGSERDNVKQQHLKDLFRFGPVSWGAMARILHPENPYGITIGQD